MILKVIFHKTAFVKFNMSNNSNERVNKTHPKQPKIQLKNPWILKISRKKSVNQKSCGFSKMLVISKKKAIPLSMDLKLNRKSIA